MCSLSLDLRLTEGCRREEVGQLLRPIFPALAGLRGRGCIRRHSRASIAPSPLSYAFGEGFEAGMGGENAGCGEFYLFADDSSLPTRRSWKCKKKWNDRRATFPI